LTPLRTMTRACGDARNLDEEVGAMSTGDGAGASSPGGAGSRLEELERRSDEPRAREEISRLVRAGLARVLPMPGDPARVRVVGRGESDAEGSGA
jgi:hypothetical protein